MSCISSICRAIPNIPEDSFCYKASSSLPVFGCLFSYFHQDSLNYRLKSTERADRTKVVELIEVKNKHKICNLISSALSITLIIAGLAAGIFATALVPVVVLGLGALIGWSAAEVGNLGKNSELIANIRANGVPWRFIHY